MIYDPPWPGPPIDKWLWELDPRQARIDVGFVGCDDLTCPARECPETPEEILAAYIHWKDHDYLAGCAHGE